MWGSPGPSIVAGMLKHLRQNLVAYLALFVALGGTSYAAVTVTGSQVKDGTLTGRDVRDGTLAVKDLNRKQLARFVTQAAPRQSGAGGAGAAGQNGANGAAGERGPQGAPGAAGQNGAASAAGAAGPQGADGAPGQKGDKGDKGEPGTMQAGGRGDGYATSTKCAWVPILSEELTLTHASRLLVDAHGSVGSWSEIASADLRIRVTRLSDGHELPALQTRTSRMPAESSAGIAISGIVEELMGVQAILQPGTYRLATEGRVAFTTGCSGSDTGTFTGQHLSWIAIRA